MTGSHSLRVFSKQTIRSYSLLLMLLASVMLSLVLALNSYRFHRTQVQAWLASLPKSMLPHLIDSDHFSVTSKVRLIHSTRLFSCFEIFDRTQTRIDGFGEGCAPSRTIPVLDVSSESWGSFRYDEDLKEPILATLAFLLFSVLASAVLILFWRGRIVSEFDRELGGLEALCQRLLLLSDQVSQGKELEPEGALTGLSGVPALQESAKLEQALRGFLTQIQQRERRIVELLDQKSAHETQLRLAELATQVAHDIRSPIAALETALRGSSVLPGDTRLLVRSASQRIRDIANGLLQHRRASLVPATPVPELVIAVLEQILSEKNTRLQGSARISMRAEPSARLVFANVVPPDFKRALSNLIENAVEAVTPGQGEIEVELSQAGDRVLVAIRDNGKGMPHDVLARLGEKGLTYGKEDGPSGSGLGVHYARVQIESWGGMLEFKSREGEGTQVILSLVKSAPPRWFASALSLSPLRPILVIDDDPSSCQAWRTHFARQDERLEVHSVSDEAGLAEWVRRHGNQATFLVDYDLGLAKDNGLDLIAKFGLERSSVLVTSSYDELSIQERCMRMSIPLLPKVLIPMIPVNSGSIDAC